MFWALEGIATGSILAKSEGAEMSWALSVPASVGTVGGKGMDPLGIKSTLLMWAAGIFLVALLGFGVYHWASVTALKSELAEQKTQVASLTVENAALTSANDKLARSIEVQNSKVEELVAASRAASVTANAAIAKATKDASRWKAKYKELLDAPRPSGDDCKDLNITIDQYLQLRLAEVGQ